MKKNITQESLIDALSYGSLRELPKKDKGEDYWIKAIALVNKIDGTSSYVVVEKDEDLNNKVKCDFGNVCAIKEFVEFYPYSFLKSSFMPKQTKGNKKDDRAAWLSKMRHGGDFTHLSAKELEREILKTAVKNQLIKEANVD